MLLSLIAAAGAVDLDLAFSSRRLAPPVEVAGWHFGDRVAGGDLDADGFSDVVVAGRTGVSVFYGGPLGVPGVADLTFQRVYDRGEDATFYGGSLAIGDLDGDGTLELLVAASETQGAVYIYDANASGVRVASEARLQPGAVSPENWYYFGSGLSVGDADGDGADDLLVGGPSYRGTEGDFPGSAFFYPSDSAPDYQCAETFIAVPPAALGDESLSEFGYATSLAADTNGDGYRDLAVACPGCRTFACPSCSAVLVWFGGSSPSFAADDALLLGVDELPPAGGWNMFGSSISGADTDDDGYDELLIAYWEGPVVYYGSPTGPDAASEQVLAGISREFAVPAGDLDGDGFVDIVASTNQGFDETSYLPWADVLFGGPDGLDLGNSMRVLMDESGNGFGSAIAGVGDTDGDGKPDFVVGAEYEGDEYGAAYVFSPTCTWYRDGDGDGYGDPTTTVSSCRTTTGYVAHPDDCDDTDGAVHGALWYADADGDGYGRNEPGSLACTEPDHASSLRFDCDDSDPLRHPDAADTTTDGVDQDCDDHDGAWTFDTGGCGDTAEPVDSGDSATDTGGETGDHTSTDTGDAPNPGESGSDPGTNLRDPACGCGSSGAQPSLLFVIAATAATRRRRARATAMGAIPRL